jgi:predicted permease
MPAPSWHTRVFRRLLRLFPAEFRGDFGDEMASDFEDQRADAARREGGIRRLWWRTVVDVLRRAPREHADVIRRDIGYALRLLRRNRALAIGGIATLALGIGLNATVFAVVSGVLLRDLPIDGSSRLVRVYEVSPPPARDLDDVSADNALDWRRATQTLDGLAFVSSPRVNFTGGSEPEQLSGMSVSEDFFHIVPVRAELGRVFNDSDYAPWRAFYAANDPHVRRMPSTAPPMASILLSHDLWQRQFHGATDVIGRTVMLDDDPVRVVGVLGPNFPLRDFRSGARVDYWIATPPVPSGRRARFLVAIGRLRADVPIARAQAELDLIANRLARAYPDDAGYGIHITPLLDTITANVSTRLWFLFGAALSVLLIGTANVAGLLLAHASGRRLEMATRVALGAGRATLVRQSVTEGLVLGAIGGAAGILVAIWTVPLIVSIAPSDIPRLDDVRITWAVVGFSVLISLATGALAGLAACWPFRHLHRRPALRSTGAGTTGHGRRLRRGLTVVEIALALMLSIAAGLLARTLRAIDAQPLGYDPAHVIAIDMPPGLAPLAHAGGLERMTHAQAALVERLRTVPGVATVGVGPRLQSSADDVFSSEAASEKRVVTQSIGPGYAEALGAVLTQGRTFRDEDVDGALVVMLNASAARLFFGSASPIGQTITQVFFKRKLTVVGVIADVRGQPEVPAAPGVYLLHGQPTNAFFSTFLIRATGDPRALLPAVRAVVHDVDPTLPLTHIQTLDDRLAESLAPRRFTSGLIGVFSTLALLLAAIGIYGLVAESVAARVPEIGVRMALGATAPRVLVMILGEGGVLVAAGLALGLAGAIALHSTMTSLVFGVKTTDAMTYAIVSIGLAAAAILACVLPARRASAIDPATALRHE